MEPTDDEATEAKIVDDQDTSVEQIAKEVLAGHWGRGLIRKDRLEKAGHDPVAVMEAVNKLMTGT